MALIYLYNSYKLNVDEYLNEVKDKVRLDKINKTSDLEKKKEHLGAYLLLRDYLETNCFLSSPDMEMTYNEFGKPFFKNIPKYFSISHSHGIIVVVVSNNPIGIDIELLDESKLKLIKKVFTEEEMKVYNTLSKDEKVEYFFEIWTSKEAIGKKEGTGISFNPSNTALLEDVVLKKIVVNKKEFILALTGDESFKIIERFNQNFMKEIEE